MQSQTCDQIKCDEAKPKCTACQTFSLECVYAKELRWSSKHEFAGDGSLRKRRRTGSASAPGSASGPQPSSTGQGLNATFQTSPAPDQMASQGSGGGLRSSDAVGDMTVDPLWPDLDGCSYEDLGLSDSLLLELDMQYSNQEMMTYGSHLGDDASMGNANMHGARNGFRNDTLPMPYPHDRDYHEDQTADDVQDARPAETLHRAESTLPGSKSSLLQTYYRLSRPGQVIGLTDESFVDYYFENVCSTFACFDSAANPFRSVVEQTWTNSAALYLTIQSTAIGHLANYYPYLAPLGLEKRSQAWKYLQRDLQSFRIGKVSSDTILLTLLLLGLSSAWHQASNLGMQYLLIARDLMQRRLQGVQSRPEGTAGQAGIHDGFFEHALMYWEMLASFIDPVPLAPLSGRLLLPTPERPDVASPAQVHPWTGVVAEVHFAVAEIGRVMRRRRGRGSALRSPATASPSSSTSEGQWANALECFLIDIELPADDEISDYNDLKTPKADLVALADAYRFAGLLEIYTLFPNLLEARLGADASIFDPLGAMAQESQSAYADTHEVWRVAMAVHILNLIKPIPITSGGCRLMPLLLIISGSQLRFPDSSLTPSDTISAQHNEIIQSRYLVEARMLVLSRKYPQRPLLQMVDIIKEVWQRLDNGDQSAHWLEVVHEMGWQTIMG
ncbi:uncharacterized protein LTR77_004664 [Saxophila tyrrhenica]|uniref:Zn(2)-C6 fungal-type domain-containing protein n=1 Tax=Saxophila tyrrhenica TaxID=1690608 RepID=A0AAV9PAF6_9PEZI|nr:hypothetical protein LTR77_004664 [Saxophila tyrrhenica]